jgi:hypothetical protein
MALSALLALVCAASPGFAQETDNNIVLPVVPHDALRPAQINACGPTISATLNTTAPTAPPGSGITATSQGLQTGRINRFGVVSTCAAPTVSPGSFTTAGSRQYHTYTVSFPTTQCVTVSLQTSGTQLFGYAVNSPFNPAAPTTGYVADPGSSGPSQTFSFTATAAANYDIVVHEVNPGAGVGIAYTLGINACVPPLLAYSPAAGGAVALAGVTTAGSTGTGAITVTPTGGGSGTGGGETSTIGSCAMSGADAASFSVTGAPLTLSFTGFGSPAQSIPLTCTSGAAARSATLTCNETIGTGAATPRTWSLTCPAGTLAPPQFAYAPTTGTTVTAAGGTTIGSSGTLTVTPSVATPGSSGSTAAETTSLSCVAPTAPFAGFGQTVTAVGAGAISGGPLSGSCTLGAAVQTQTLSCTENRGGTAVPVSWTLSCPAGTLLPLTASPASGATVALAGFIGGGPSVAAITFTNPNAVAATLNCTAPASPFSLSPLTVNIPANSSQAATVSFNAGAPGVYTGTLNCAVAGSAQTLTYNLTASLAEARAVDAVSAWTRVALVLLLLGVGAGALSYSRRY